MMQKAFLDGRPFYYWLGSVLAQGQRQVIELIDDNIPALEKSHLLMLLAGFIIGMQHRSRIATPALFIGKSDDGRHREGGNGGAIIRRQHRGHDDFLLRDNLKKTAGVIAAFTVRAVHHGVKGPAGAKIKGQNLGLPGLRAPPGSE